MKRDDKARLPGRLHHVDGTCIEFLKRRKRRDNTSGYTGVYVLRNGKFRAGIGFKGKRYDLGTYDTLEEAAQMRKSAKVALHDGFIKEHMKNTSDLCRYENTAKQKSAI